MSRGLAWPIRSVIAGAAGTAAMTLAYASEHRLRPQVHGALDYDDGLIPGKIVANVLRLGFGGDVVKANRSAAQMRSGPCQLRHRLRQGNTGGGPDQQRHRDIGL